jgi:hypothetical protein
MVYTGQFGELERLEDVLISWGVFKNAYFRDRVYDVLGLVKDGHWFADDYAVDKATMFQRIITLCQTGESKYFSSFLELIIQEGPEGECRVQSGSNIQEDTEDREERAEALILLIQRSFCHLHG